MKRLAMVSLVVFVGAALPACAQHGAAHGGSFGHSAPVFHASPPASSGFRPSAPTGYRAAPSYSGISHPGTPYPGTARYSASRPAYAPRYSTGAPVYPYAYSSARRAAPYSQHTPNGNRQPYRPPYRGRYNRGLYYGGAYLGWPAPYYLSDPYFDPYSYGDSYDNSLDGGYYGDQSVPPYAAYNDPGDNSGYGPDYGPGSYPAPDSSIAGSNFGPEYAPMYRPDYPPASPNSRRASPAAQPIVTLVFKDGRKTEQIHNYLLSRDTITVWDGSNGDLSREIHIDQLNVASTEKANSDAGVDFYLPRTFR
jgi:hypothetical protein